MAIPNPPVTPNTSKLHYLLYDNTGTNAAALWHSVAEITVNSEVVGVAHVGTHVDGGTSTGSDAVVLMAGQFGGVVQALNTDGTGNLGVSIQNGNTTSGANNEDDPHSSGSTGLFVLAVRKDNPISDITDTDGDYSPIAVNSAGAIYVSGVATETTLSSAFIELSTINGNTVGLSEIVREEDGDWSTSLLDKGAYILGRRNDTASTVFTTANDSFSAIAVDQYGRVGITELGSALSVSVANSTLPCAQSGSWNVLTELNTADLDTGGGTDTQAIVGLVYAASGGSVLVSATNPLPVVGTAATEYTEGQTDPSITGVAFMWEDAGDTLASVSSTKPLPVAIITGGGTGGTASTDEAAFTAGAGSGTPMMGFATADTLSSGQVGVVGMTTARALFTTMRDDAGDSCMDGANNALRVNIVAGAGSGGTALTDNSTFTVGSTLFTPMGGTFNDAATDPTAGQGAVARITSKRGVHVNLRTAAGTEIGTSGSPIRVDPTGTTTQPVSGTVQAAQSGAWSVTNVSGTVSLPTGAATSANQSTEITSLQLLDDVVATAASAALGKLYQVGGTDGTNARILSTNTSGHVNIADGGNSITVDNGGTFAVQSAQSGTWNVTNISGTVSLPTGAATATNQSTEITSLQLLDDVVATDGSAALTKLYQVGGTDGTNAQILSTDTSGRLNVNVIGGPTGGTSSVDDSAFTPAVGSGTPLMGMADEAATDSVDEGDVGVVRMTLDRKLLTRVVGSTDANRLEVDASGRVTANLAAGTNNIGDVDVLSVPVPLSTTGNGASSAALRVTLANDSTGTVVASAGTGAFACNVACASAAVSVGASATALPASALASRRRVVIQNRDTTNSLFVGPSGVTTSSGMEIFPNFAQSFEAGPGIGLFGITTGATVDARVLELS